MSRNELYPWSLLTEVGDYFVVPKEFKEHDYMSRLVSQKNYRREGPRRFISAKTSIGTIVMLAEIEGEVPPHEFVSAEGILSSTSRQHLLRTMPHDNPIGDKPQRAKRTQKEIVAMMSQEMRLQNLPWWFDPHNGKLLMNLRVAKDPELTAWQKNEFTPTPETPYPDHYNLDANLMVREEPDPGEVDEVEDEWAGLSVGGGDDD